MNTAAVRSKLAGIKNAALAGSTGRSSHPSGRPVILFGAGNLGLLTLAKMAASGVAPVAFADNSSDRRGRSIQGIEVLGADEAVDRYARSADFVVTIYNGSPARAQLRAAGCEHVLHFADYFRQHDANFLPFCGISSRRVILDAWNEIERACFVWSDERSTLEYLAQLQWRLDLPSSEMPAHDSPESCYFPDDVFSYLPQEALVDCGAFDGDSVRAYLRRRPADGRSKILALEPDPVSYKKLVEYSESLYGDGTAIRAEPWAVADKSGPVRFDPLGTVTSGVSESGHLTVTAKAIDDLQFDPTLIKMDVEGYELAALQGAERSIRERRPVLAISLYHHAADLWAIPTYLGALTRDYRLFLRRYAEDCWELVMYAVPIERVRG